MAQDGADTSLKVTYVWAVPEIEVGGGGALCLGKYSSLEEGMHWGITSSPFEVLEGSHTA